MELAAAPAAPETLQPPQPDYEASKPKKEDYTDNKEYRRDYKRWHTFKTRDQEYSAKRQRELDENSCLQSVLRTRSSQPPVPCVVSRTDKAGENWFQGKELNCRKEKADPAPALAPK